MTTPRDIAKQMGYGFMAHDYGEYAEAVTAFAAVDDYQFAHIDTEAAERAARAYTDALFSKDDVEDRHRNPDGSLDTAAIADADWSDVRNHLLTRARIANINRDYANKTVEFWRSRIVGDDYWTPTMHAQTYEVRAALQNDDYPDKDGLGSQGWGLLPVLYLVGVEAHDTRNYERGLASMEEYYRRIAQAHET